MLSKDLLVLEQRFKIVEFHLTDSIAMQPLLELLEFFGASAGSLPGKF